MFTPILAMEQHAALVIHERHAEAAHQRLLSWSLSLSLRKLRFGRKARAEAPENEAVVTRAPRQEWAEA
jgi:hypothetical protein